MSASTETQAEALALALFSLWRDRLNIAEHIEIEFIQDDSETDHELEARTEYKAFAEPDGSQRWSFVIYIVPDTAAQKIERTIVHELVHILLWALRSAVFRPFVNPPSDFVFFPDPKEHEVETWETVIERLADTFIRAYG